MLNTVKTEIDMLSNAIEVIRGREGDEATCSKQNAKRSQGAGRLIVDRARQENNVRKISGLSKVPMGRNRFKGEFTIRVLSERVQGDGFKSPSAEGQKRVNGVNFVLSSRAGRSGGS